MDKLTGSSNEELFFIADVDTSAGEDDIELSPQKRKKTCRHPSPSSRESSPPLLLAFNNSSRQTLQDRNQSPVSSLDPQEEVDEDSNHSIEEWMILGRKEEVGDSSIQLHLSYPNNSEDDSEDEDQNVRSDVDTWTVSEKDKCGVEKSQPIRYWVPGNSQTCNICNRMGHLAENCYYQKKWPTCVLCGMQGHIQRDCPGRPCPSCGLPSHSSRPCERPPVFNQHCRRCRMTGHLTDSCPDTWRQYHLTVRLEVPLRPSTVHTVKQKECLTFCYNCSKRGHYGYECTKRRMVSRTFPSLPYVCHYDTIDDILKRCTTMHEKPKGQVNAGCLPLSGQQTDLIQESGEEDPPVQARFRTKQDACTPAGRKKTWPERRRERREVKRLRREAQARREGGLLGRSWGKFDDEVGPSDPFRSPFLGHKQFEPRPQRKRKDVAEGRKSKKTREAERWKKRGGLKRGDLYPSGGLDISSENLLSPKQRVRHRRR
ncbi:zinc finger CCHC domain-containing protein 7-like [Cheilinus undulatus]|uniref:zinc finger CCHC domain-containing protein 7-like n=1 Tax=Cheilinus undulatus TaxID=241271 RepID=UPI001BD5D988|nr:zinc finger CCHC domain-containing protein 7-like [Cheilinus undulatus]